MDIISILTLMLVDLTGNLSPLFIGDIWEGFIDTTIGQLVDFLLDALINAFLGLISYVFELAIYTPHPVNEDGETVLTAWITGNDSGLDDGWEMIREYTLNETIVLANLLLVGQIAFIFLFAALSPFLGSFEKERLFRRWMLALFFTYGWLYLAGAGLSFAHHLANAIAGGFGQDDAGFEVDPDPDDSGSLAIQFIGMLILLLVKPTIILGILMLYAVRNFVLLTFVYAMPVLIAMWPINTGFMTPVSQMASSWMKKFTPLLFLTIPNAFLLRIAALINEAEGDAAGDFALYLLGDPDIPTEVGSLLAYLIILALPLAVLILPKFIFGSAAMGFSIGSKIGGSSGQQQGRQNQQEGQQGQQEGTDRGPGGDGGADPGTDPGTGVPDDVGEEQEDSPDSGGQTLTQKAGSKVGNALDNTPGFSSNSVGGKLAKKTYDKASPSARKLGGKVGGATSSRLSSAASKGKSLAGSAKSKIGQNKGVQKLRSGMKDAKYGLNKRTQRMKDKKRQLTKGVKKRTPDGLKRAGGTMKRLTPGMSSGPQAPSEAFGGDDEADFARDQETLSSGDVDDMKGAEEVVHGDGEQAPADALMEEDPGEMDLEDVQRADPNAEETREAAADYLEQGLDGEEIDHADLEDPDDMSMDDEAKLRQAANEIDDDGQSEHLRQVLDPNESPDVSERAKDYQASTTEDNAEKLDEVERRGGTKNAEELTDGTPSTPSVDGTDRDLEDVAVEDGVEEMGSEAVELDEDDERTHKAAAEYFDTSLQDPNMDKVDKKMQETAKYKDEDTDAKRTDYKKAEKMRESIQSAQNEDYDREDEPDYVDQSSSTNVDEATRHSDAYDTDDVGEAAEQAGGSSTDVDEATRHSDAYDTDDIGETVDNADVGDTDTLEGESEGTDDGESLEDVEPPEDWTLGGEDEDDSEDSIDS